MFNHLNMSRFVTSLDVSFFSRFKYIERLLLVHGHWCYDRLARMVRIKSCDIDDNDHMLTWVVRTSTWQRKWWWYPQCFFQGFAFLLQKRCVCLCLFLVCIFFHSFVLTIRFSQMYHFAGLPNAKITPLICMLSFQVHCWYLCVQNYKIKRGFSWYLRHCSWQKMCLSLSHFCPGSSCTVASPAK